MTGRAHAAIQDRANCRTASRTLFRTNRRDPRCHLVQKKKSSPMRTQPLDDGRDRPQQMTSRMRVIGPKQPARNDSSRSAKVRASALKKQREALRK
jgi:hypothetical protein